MVGRARALCEWFSPRPDGGSPDGDLADIEVIEDGGPGGPGGPGDAGGAAVLADPPRDALADKQDPQGEPQVINLDSS